jgi:hypothetical protein
MSARKPFSQSTASLGDEDLSCFLANQHQAPEATSTLVFVVNRELMLLKIRLRISGLVLVLSNVV